MMLRESGKIARSKRYAATASNQKDPPENAPAAATITAALQPFHAANAGHHATAAFAAMSDVAPLMPCHPRLPSA